MKIEGGRNYIIIFCFKGQTCMASETPQISPKLKPNWLQSPNPLHLWEEWSEVIKYLNKNLWLQSPP